MDYKLIFWLISFITFWGYAVWYSIKWGIPNSWSDTFYDLDTNYKSKNKGYILTGVLWTTAFCLLPVALGENNLMFPVLAAIMFIGAAPAFKDTKMEKIVHYIGAYTAVSLGVIAIGVSYNLWYIALLLTALIAGLQFKWKPKGKITYIESLVILTGHIVTLLKNVLTI